MENIEALTYYIHKKKARLEGIPEEAEDAAIEAMTKVNKIQALISVCEDIQKGDGDRYAKELAKVIAYEHIRDNF